MTQCAPAHSFYPKWKEEYSKIDGEINLPVRIISANGDYSSVLSVTPILPVNLNLWKQIGGLYNIRIDYVIYRWFRKIRVPSRRLPVTKSYISTNTWVAWGHNHFFYKNNFCFWYVQYFSLNIAGICSNKVSDVFMQRTGTPWG